MRLNGARFDGWRPCSRRYSEGFKESSYPFLFALGRRPNRALVRLRGLVFLRLLCRLLRQPAKDQRHTGEDEEDEEVVHYSITAYIVAAGGEHLLVDSQFTM
jgi:hypothetical protein